MNASELFLYAHLLKKKGNKKKISLIETTNFVNNTSNIIPPLSMNATILNTMTLEIVTWESILMDTTIQKLEL